MGGSLDRFDPNRLTGDQKNRGRWLERVSLKDAGDIADNLFVSVAAAIDEPKSPVDQGGGPLSPQHQQDLLEANRRVRKILGAVKVATFNGWTTAVFAGLSLICSLFSVTALLMGIGLAVVAWNEFRGKDLLQGFDPRGVRLLGWNQVGFIGLLVAYSLWGIFTGLTGPDPYQAYIDQNPALAPMLGSIGGLHTALTLAVYGGVIVCSIVFQGLNSLYYFKRGAMLKAYLNQTPPWIVQLQRQSAL